MSPSTSSINNQLQVPSANWRTQKHQSMVPYVIKEVSIDRQYICQYHIYFFLSQIESCQKILMRIGDGDGRIFSTSCKFSK